MVISFQCPACGNNLRADDRVVGKRAKCRCGQVVVVPRANGGVAGPPRPRPQETVEAPPVAPGQQRHPNPSRLWSPNAAIANGMAPVYAQMGVRAPVVAQLAAGNEIELSAIRTSENVAWVEVTLPGGEQGYILGTTEVFKFKVALLLGPEVVVSQLASAHSRPVDRLAKGAIFTITGSERQGEQGWVRVRTGAGGSGYIPGNTRVDLLPICPQCCTLDSGKTWGTILAILAPLLLLLLAVEATALVFLPPATMKLISEFETFFEAALVIPFLLVITWLVGRRKCQRCGTKWFDIRYLNGPPTC
jgi:hypothetical protein